MGDVTTELNDLLQARRSALKQLIMNSSNNAAPIPGVPSTTPEALEQMANGFFILVEEALAGRRDTRDFYVSTVMPGLRDSGSPVEAVVGGSSRVLSLIAFDLAGRVSPENRAAAEEWLATFFGNYLGEMAAVWSVGR